MTKPSFILSLPIPNNSTIANDFSVKQSVVFIGANGSGKSRLGAWLDIISIKHKDKVHRISAQKSLEMPESVSPQSIIQSEFELLYGNANYKQIASKHKAVRWGNKPNTHLINDFDKLMVYLFSDHFEASSTYLEESKISETRVEPPATKLDIVKQIWESVLPHRKLIIGGGKIDAHMIDNPDSKYTASEMSDGERVIFYLIGQSLAAPKDGIIVIDEPELHINKSIQIPLWNEIEKARPDCLFVYFTHDVDFAAAKSDGTKIWLKSFDGTHWDWEEIKSVEGLPEELVIELLGSRRNILFVEGESGSYDAELFRLLYPNHLVMSRGSCSQVIALTKAFRKEPQFHHLKIHGIVDRDRRTDNEITALEESGISVLSVAEVENLFCVPEILELISDNQGFRLEDNKVKEAIKNVIQALKDELNTQISLRASAEIKFQLARLGDVSKGKQALIDAMAVMTNNINVVQIYDEAQKVFDDAIEAND
jgi:Protein of unknown function (DUF4435)/AAA domain, putative AbiEii toxin, Type IV TA system